MILFRPVTYIIHLSECYLLQDALPQFLVVYNLDKGNTQLSLSALILRSG